MSHDDKNAQMSYDDKIDALVTAITPHVAFKSVEQAKEYASWHKYPAGSAVSSQMHGKAKELRRLDEIRYALTYFGTCKRTGLSALRVAIKVYASKYVENDRIEVEQRQAQPKLA